MSDSRHHLDGRPSGVEPRDAIHMAIIPMQAGHTLNPGAEVEVLDGKGWRRGESQLRQVGGAQYCGVVNPFVREVTEAGGWFWLLIHPGTITSLRHEWSHPAFPLSTDATVAERAESEEWLKEFIGSWYKDGPDGKETYGPMYKEVIADILRGDGGTVYGREEREPPSEFWFHLERYTGRTIAANFRNEYFSCVC